MLSTEALSSFRQCMRGGVTAPGDPQYDAARKVYNGMIDRRPAAVAQCRDVADVVAAVDFGRAQNLPVSIRCGGHNGGGLAVCDDGLVIDLSAIRYVHVDRAARTVRVGGGTTWGDVDHATHAYGLAVPAGIISTTGVGGLTLGGGIGHLTRTCGLTIDNLLEADLVLADGRTVVASERENPDLFWAIRGGGGNFGVVTSFLFRAHQIHTVVAGPMLWDLDEAPAILRWYREFIPTAPVDMNGFFGFLQVPPGPPFPEHLHMRKMSVIMWCCPAPEPRVAEMLEPLRRAHPPALDLVGALPHPAVQSMFDALYPPGLQWYWRADFFDEIQDEAIVEHVAFARELPSMLSTMHLYPVDGAVHRVGRDETAWSYRDSTWSGVIVGVDPDAANREVITDWTKRYWEALHPYSAGGAYVNFMMDEGEDRIRATYRHNYDRLAEVKARYDPSNFFRMNQNIRPAGERTRVAGA